LLLLMVLLLLLLSLVVVVAFETVFLELLGLVCFLEWAVVATNRLFRFQTMKMSC
jgi:hypothetical protein